MLLYLANFAMGFFGHSIGFIHGNSLMGIGFSAVVVVIAALNLILDFDLIESGAQSGAPKYMRSEEHTSELQSLMRISYAVFCLKKKNKTHKNKTHVNYT